MSASESPEPRERVDEAGERAYLPTLLAVLAWYAAPAALYAAWMLFAAGPQPCADGEACSRAARIGEGFAAALAWGLPSLALSLLIAVLLRLPAVGWRSASTGAAAAILGAGITTVILRSAGFDIG